ncbi:hypothetical protein SAMN05421837_118105 [Amycolatopsis pretoriensis]|uniref:Uncharacterized protein n=1 Tax=Amycolatopsis pretoriensis TaxID=218821 RepID=A0A1H5RJ93_9PSEU|nr:hypothetical protein [Amycolatopsis pretoriensis]SEF38154.1 hypothetical protein SAMN05421837_118105 [Amycolatopsis pretoriensis]
MTAMHSTALDHAVAPPEIQHVFENASVDARRALLSEPAIDQA